MKYTVPPGVFDIVPVSAQEPWRNSHLWQYVEGHIRQLAQAYGFNEMRTPIFERAELWQRGVGESTDIVSKEMYLFEDKGKRLMSLRPEGTAAAMRAFIENQLGSQGSVQKLYYIGPMFRYDRPQAGRYRQHHQFGVEAIGSDSPEQDVEVIDLLYTLYSRLNLKGLRVFINSIADPESRSNFRDALRDYLRPHFAELSTDSQARFELNPLRILDSKDPKDQEFAKGAPSILDFLNSASQDHFEKVKQLLQAVKIPFEINPKLVRGLDYYNNTVFEVVAGELGAQNSIGGGGRYDGLLKLMGGPDLPAMGFGTGIERIIQTMLKQEASIPPQDPIKVFLIPLGTAAQERCFTLLREIRQHNISATMDFSGRKLAKVMQLANQLGAQFVVVMGDEELQKGQVELKAMATGQKQTLSIEDLVSHLAS